MKLISKNKLTFKPIWDNLMSFHDEGKEIGVISIKNSKMMFKGNADESAKKLFEYLKGYIDEYIEEKRGDKI